MTDNEFELFKTCDGTWYVLEKLFVMADVISFQRREVILLLYAEKIRAYKKV